MSSPTAEIIAFLRKRLPVIDFNEESPPERDVVERFQALARGDKPIDDLVLFVHRCFARSRNRHVIVRGESGTGKSTLLRAFPTMIATEPHDSRPYSAIYFDVNSVGPDDSRGLIESLLALCERQSELLLCVDGFANLFPRPNGQNNLHLLGLLAQLPSLRLLTTMTNSQFETSMAEQALLRDWFEVVELVEPDDPTLLRICSLHVARRTQNVSFGVDPEFASLAIKAGHNFLINDSNPGKSIRLIDRAIENLKFDQALRPDRSATLDSQQVHSAVQEISGIDVTRFRETQSDNIKDLLSELVFGQPEATAVMARELEMFRSGLNDPRKPASVIMLAGTTGVGKTELAKAVCQLYSQSKQLRIFTMGNYTEPHSVSSIIGVPPGYVGHENGGQIVNQLLADPFSVFLLDEAEKAHANVWKPFLNLFDEGWIVDQRGQKAYARNAIFLITTNAGEKVARQHFEREEPYDSIVDKVKQAILRYRPERGNQPVFNEQFLARVNEVIVFRPLDLQTFEEITAAQLKVLKQRWWNNLGLEIVIDPEIVPLVAGYCYQKNQASQDREGGRLVRHTLKSTLEAHLLDYVRTTVQTTRVNIQSVLDTPPQTTSNLKASFRFKR